MLKLRFIYLFLLAIFATQTFAKESGNVLLAKQFKSGMDVTQFLVSEKYDGVRALWDGKSFISRAGNPINAPAWFTKNFPKTPLDGELWRGHGQFEAASGAVRKGTPVDEEWKNISYMVFELPNAAGTFEERAKRIVEIVQKAHLSHLKAVKQFRVKDEAELNQLLKKTVVAGGEGLMLHRANAPYTTGRSDALLKLKLLYDAEAKVIEYIAGKGKYAGKMGALLVETPEGVRFKLGTGFSDAQRANPPAIGSLVTYTYRDVTKKKQAKICQLFA